MSQKNQNSEVPEPMTPRSSRKELPWFVCAAITTGLVAFCYEYSESLEDSSTLTSKGAQRTSHPTEKSDFSMSDESNIIADEHGSQDDPDATGRAVFNVITMIICCMALIVTWSSKSSDDDENTSKTVKDNEDAKKDK